MSILCPRNEVTKTEIGKSENFSKIKKDNRKVWDCRWLGVWLWFWWSLPKVIAKWTILFNESGESILKNKFGNIHNESFNIINAGWTWLVIFWWPFCLGSLTFLSLTAWNVQCWPVHFCLILPVIFQTQWISCMTLMLACTGWNVLKIV